MELYPFGKKEVSEMVIKHFGTQRGEEILSNFSEDTCQLCRLPQDCEFVINIIEQKGEIPVL
jgi:hypothetical protein